MDFLTRSTRYIQCIHQKLYQLTHSDYEEFANIILSARAAFQITPEGTAQFKDWLQSIRRYAITPQNSSDIIDFWSNDNPSICIFSFHRKKNTPTQIQAMQGRTMEADQQCTATNIQMTAARFDQLNRNVAIDAVLYANHAKRVETREE